MRGIEALPETPMSDLIELEKYRLQRRKHYLQKYRSHLDESIQYFIHHHFHLQFDSIRFAYLEARTHQNEVAWDYCDFRETLKEALSEVFGQELWNELKTQPWFDSRFINHDELIERCLSLFILGPAVSGMP